MFHTIITLAYIIPNIYVFIRIWQQFINKGYRLHYSIVYVLLACIYPISNLISENAAGFISRLLAGISDYLLPFYLYLFLSVLAFDIFLLINLLLKILPAEKRKTTRFKITVLSAIISLSVLVVAAGAINFNTIRKSEYQITVPGRSCEIKHLKIAFAADFHLKANTDIRFVKRFVEKISEINPDLMVFGGDMVEGDREDGDIGVSESLLRNIKSRYGIYAVPGNHEHYAGEGSSSFFENAGMKLLIDTNIIIDRSFILSGRIDSHFRNRKSIGDLLKSVPDSLPLILLDHRPTEIDEVSHSSVDVQLSGHTHNGQLFPINLITRKVYRLSWGHKKIGNTDFFVTSGIRLWGPPVRTAGKSEIMVINITFTP